MNLLASLNIHFGKLVHPALQERPYEFAAHRNFLATRLAVSVGALVAAPLCLVLGPAPAWWQAVALAWLLLPAAAVAAVSRTGHLPRGEALSLAAWIGLAATLAIGGGSGAGLGLLLLVPLEVALAATPVSMTGLIGIVVAALVAIVTPVLAGLGLRPVDPRIITFAAGLTAAAQLYAVVMALMAGRLEGRRRRDEHSTHERYEELTNLIDDVPLRLDRSGMVMHVGASAQRLFGLKARDLLGRGLFDHVHVADRPSFLKLVSDAADGVESLGAVLRIRTGLTTPSPRGAFQEPVFFEVEFLARPQGLPRPGAPASVLCLMTDVSARQRQSAALIEAEAEARRAETSRTLFLANVSHELRTPLNAIIGFADMLASESLGPREPAKQREYASIILQSGHHLLALVNTILDASKIESGSFTILPEPFDLARLIHGCCDMVGLKAEAGAIEIVRDVAGVTQEVIGDERAYKQILLNLLSNAIKFTPGGGRIHVTARPQGTSVILTVADDGVGISPGDLPKLGTPFFQAQTTYDRSFDGTGLGLSVVRGLVALHGGSMAIESAIGQGTRVCLRFPADCRPHLNPRGFETKIETIPRYSPQMQPLPGQADLARMHKSA